MIIVVGGGPAGMMAAISASSSKIEVTLIEKNASLGKKLLMTGGGRCNLTNKCDPQGLAEHFSKTGNFLRDAFKVFNNKTLLSFFLKRGLKTKIEENGRVFPVTDKAASVLDVLKKELNSLGVKILLKKRIKEILLDKGRVKGIICSDGSAIKSKKVIIASGGFSYRTTGSSGDGIRIAEKAGHKIVHLRPGLVSLDLTGSCSESLEGLSLSEVTLTFRSGRTKFTSHKGSLIFTKTGISGPVTFSSSAKVVDWMIAGKKVSLEIDLKPQMSLEDVIDDVSRELSRGSGKSLKNVLREIVPHRLVDVLLEVAKAKARKKANQITAKEIKQLAVVLKGLKFSVSGSGSFEKAQVTRGGVSVKDIDPKTMESKKVKGLYFAGEMIDVDGDCGGFNLQAAFSTGFLAGRSASVIPGGIEWRDLDVI